MPKVQKRAKWDKRKLNRAVQLIQIILAVPAFICLLIGVGYLFGGNFLKSLILIALSLPVFLSKYVLEKQYEKKYSTITEKYAPVFGSMNGELRFLAERQGKTIPSPTEAIAIVNGFVPDEPTETKTNGTPESQYPDYTTKKAVPLVSTNEPIMEVILFCRKCGAQLQSDSDFCHKCGTKVIR